MSKLIVTAFPKGPFHTKNAIVMKIIVFYYCGSILLSVPIYCHSPRKSSIKIAIAVANYYRRSDLLSVVFLVSQGRLGSWEKATTKKDAIFQMRFFLCFRLTINFEGGCPVDPLFEPPAHPPFDSTSQKLFLSSFRCL